MEPIPIAPGPRTRATARPRKHAAVRATVAALVVAGALAACGRPRTDIAQKADDGTAEPLDSITLLDPVDGATAAISPEPEPPDEYYFDLTAFDWYRRGEPLRIDDRAYALAGGPEATGERILERAGEFQGVAYYVERGATEPYSVVYVPVFPGYWLPFASQEPAPQPAE